MVKDASNAKTASWRVVEIAVENSLRLRNDRGDILVQLYNEENFKTNAETIIVILIDNKDQINMFFLTDKTKEQFKL